LTVGEALKLILNSAPGIEVIGWAKNGKECLTLIQALSPDIIVMDINMPVMDGIETTRRLKEKFPSVPVLIVSSAVKDDLGKTFTALEAGAIDILERPSLFEVDTSQCIGSELIKKVIKVGNTFKRFSTTRRVMNEPSFIRKKSLSDSSPGCLIPYEKKRTHFSDKIIIIGASTGGPPVLKFILSKLPLNFPSTIFIVQHISPGFTDGLAGWLRIKSNLPVILAKDNSDIRKGHVYLPPDNHLIELTESGKISLVPVRKKNEHAHPIDFLMESGAKTFHNNCIGVLLTGMGNDGAKGIKLIRKSGGRTIAQDCETSTVFGMPKAAIGTGFVEIVCPYKKIPAEIISLCMTNKQLSSNKKVS
jgi:two-component system chemotaxis response regulator CheB